MLRIQSKEFIEMHVPIHTGSTNAVCVFKTLLLTNNYSVCRIMLKRRNGLIVTLPKKLFYVKSRYKSKRYFLTACKTTAMFKNIVGCDLI